MNIFIASSILAVFMAILAMFVRMKAAKKPTSTKKILLPPLFMSTGALMFVFPIFRVSSFQIFEAVLAGLFFSIFLIKTSKFEIRDKEIFLKRSRAFLFVLVGLIVIRISAKLILSSSISIGELGGMFWILAFSMIVPWRIMMYVNFRRLRLEMRRTHETHTVT